ncbi:hypothetical protein WKR88_04990 [Trinickia caryophylli]|uniref:Uncharacterized protein n=1 Tax=Trinickia caryophylli TaxID=28094 RepID=A0A1X7FJ02_TRICW|nr:hypothetical protein [Trinickia caryophylli]TRX19266.1 hypothetical protein FNF07_14220 [Trinickia caryophylli]WQE13430.1 hypothetical protein U0034_08725 [Trinickia caryophylli]GLU34046.1 hypothetical protein Busp01_38880 [Trinickia caryophylli]SMF52992.1 hypothetical protein SAMN06295900_10987 [Trinickia caryophylli]
MNWRRLYAVSQIIGVVGGISVGAAGFYAVIVIAICRKVIGLSDGVASFAIGLPFFILLLVVFVRYLPGRLRKAGMLSDDSSKFGPWFKN